MARDDVDPNDLDLFTREAHHDMFARLRRSDPLYWHDNPWGGGFWSVTTYDDLVAVSRDPRTYSSERGIVLPTREAAPAPLGGIIMTDPPRHTRMRQIVNKGFTPRAIEALEPAIRAVVDDVLGHLAGTECDFVADVSQQIPLVVICKLMGIPEHDVPTMIEITNRVIGGEDPELRPAASREEDLETGRRHAEVFLSLIDERRQRPRDDLTSRLIAARLDGEPFNDVELYQFFMLLIAGGVETTRHSMSGGMLELVRDPAQRERLEADISLVPEAVEEILRWTSPITHMARVATRDAELRGARIREGDRVALWYASANRDEAVFGPDSMQFRIDRRPNEHLAFGVGQHFCLGAALARLELRVLFEELATRTCRWELVRPPEWIRSNFIGGIKRMPVRFALR